MNTTTFGEPAVAEHTLYTLNWFPGVRDVRSVHSTVHIVYLLTIHSQGCYGVQLILFNSINISIINECIHESFSETHHSLIVYLYDHLC